MYQIVKDWLIAFILEDNSKSWRYHAKFIGLGVIGLLLYCVLKGSPNRGRFVALYVSTVLILIGMPMMLPELLRQTRFWVVVSLGLIVNAGLSWEIAGEMSQLNLWVIGVLVFAEIVGMQLMLLYKKPK